MACKPFITKTESGERIIGFICGPRGRAKKCAYCSRPSTKLCDFPVPDPKPTHGLETTTCDKPLCGQCARHTEPDTDVCRVHPEASR